MKYEFKKLICKFMPLTKRIVFESNPEFSCNTLPVYQEMMRRRIDKEYEIYWLVEDKEKYKNGNCYYSKLYDKKSNSNDW